MKRNKIIALGLVACMACGILAGCGEKKTIKNDAENKVKNEQSIENKVDNKNENGKEVKDDVYVGITTTDANKHLCDVINYARNIAEENEAYKPVIAADQKDAEIIMQMVGVTAEDMSEYAISVSPINTKAYGVAIIKPAEGKTEVVKAGLDGFVANQIKAFETYLPDQFEIAKAATVTEVEGYYVLVMSDNATTLERIEDALKNPTVMDAGKDTEDSDKAASTNGNVEAIAPEVTDSGVNNVVVPEQPTVSNDTREGAVTVDPNNGAANTSDTWE